MARAHLDGTGIELCYESFGDRSRPTVLLVMGLGTQMLGWDPEFCEMIVERGFHVVRYDNRDVGLSTHLTQPIDVLAVFDAVYGGRAVEVPYLLSDMAADAAGLLDQLGVARAHVVGVSMGGMIVQTMAIEHRHRVLSMTSIMSTTGDADVGQPTPEAMQAVLAPPSQSREEAQARTIEHAHIWGSPGLFEPERLRRLAGEQWDRDHDPEGGARQVAAIMASGSRTEALRSLDVPTLVIHGTADRLVQPTGGERTAAVIPDAKLLLVDGMGHDLPRALWPRLVGAITDHAIAHAEPSRSAVRSDSDRV